MTLNHIRHVKLCPVIGVHVRGILLSDYHSIEHSNLSLLILLIWACSNSIKLLRLKVNSNSLTLDPFVMSLYYTAMFNISFKPLTSLNLSFRTYYIIFYCEQVLLPARQSHFGYRTTGILLFF